MIGVLDKVAALAVAVFVCGSASLFAQATTTVNWFNSSGTTLRDTNGTPLSPGAADTNSDGMLVQLGYYANATAANKFAGTWVPITGAIGLPRTSVGDSPRQSAAEGGAVGFNTFFIAGSADVEVYDPAVGDVGHYQTRSSVAITSTTPPDQQLLAIRFYDTADGVSGHYNAVSATTWRWIAPTAAGPIVTIDLANSAVEFEAGADPYRTSVSVEPAPTTTPSPSPTSTPTPTASPTATSTPFSSPTPAPTATPLISATPTPTPASQLLNLSTRMQVGVDNNVLIGGFIVVGSESKKVMLRGLGPSVQVTGALSDPTLELHDSTLSLIAANDNWADQQPDEIGATGVAPTKNAEAAIVASLPTRARSEGGASYTATLAGKNRATGIGLLEIYDLAASASSVLANISTRGLVGGGNDVLIGGFIPGPADRAPLKVLVRALGPSLAAQGVEGTLQDPVLELHDANGTLLVNDNWRTAPNVSEIEATLPPNDDRESAIIVTLPPSNGGYTAVVRGANNSAGVALVEVYALN